RVDEEASTSSPEQRRKLALESLLRLWRHLERRLLAPRDRVPQELALRGPGHRALVPVDLQPETLREEALQRCHHPLARFLRPHVHVAVVGVAHEAVPALLQLLIQLVEQDVAEQGRERTTL